VQARPIFQALKGRPKYATHHLRSGDAPSPFRFKFDNYFCKNSSPSLANTCPGENKNSVKLRQCRERSALFTLARARLPFQFTAMSHAYALKPFTHGFSLL
jgi:hypothetical protein